MGANIINLPKSDIDKILEHLNNVHPKEGYTIVELFSTICDLMGWENFLYPVKDYQREFSNVWGVGIMCSYGDFMDYLIRRRMIRHSVNINEETGTIDFNNPFSIFTTNYDLYYKNKNRLEKISKIIGR